MKAVKIPLLVLGIILFMTGVYYQDGSLTGAVVALNVISRSQGVPSWQDINYSREYIQERERIGLVLKLTGLAILFGLFFLKMHQVSKKYKTIIGLPTLLGVGSAACFVAYVLMAPSAKIGEWLRGSLVFVHPAGLDARGLEQIRDAYLGQGVHAITGMLLFAGALFLLAGALLVYRRGIVKLISAPTAIPVLFLITQREVSEIITSWDTIDTIKTGGLLSFVMGILLILLVLFFIWAMIVRNKKPVKSSLLTVLLLVTIGCGIAAFWILLRMHISRANPAHLSFLSGATMHDVYQDLVVPIIAGALLTNVLLLSSIFLPILCAFSLRTPCVSEKDKHSSPSRLPLIAMLVMLSVFVVAGFFGLRTNPYKESLGAFGNMLGDVAPEHRKRLESEDGLHVLQSIMNDPREHYWHPFAMIFLWEECHSPKGKELVFDMLLDNKNYIASAYAAQTIMGLDRFSIMEDVNQDELLAHLSHRPELGSHFFETVIETGFLSSGFAMDIINTCNEAGVNKFILHNKKPSCKEDDLLIVPEGFTVHFNCKPKPAAQKFTAKLLWYKRNSFELSTHPRDGRAILEVNGNMLGFALSMFGELVPDYGKFEQDLRETQKLSATKQKKLWVELEVNSLLPAYHIKFLLDACARAGINEISIKEH